MKTRSRNVVRLLTALLLAAFCREAAADVPKGVWLDDFAAATNSAFTTGTPIVLVASKAGCSHCADLEAACASASFKSWMAQERFLFCRVKKDTANAYAYIGTAGWTQPKIREFPYVALIWPRADGDRATRFVGRSGEMPAKDGSLSAQLSKSADSFFDGYTPGPSGTFVVPNTPSARLEATVGRPVSVAVPLRRTDGSKAEAYELRAVLPGGAGTLAYPVAFAAGAETPTALPVVRAEAGAFAAGDVIALELACEGESVARSSIVFTDVPTSTKNPLWLGERDAATLQPGEWTMDVDLAQTCAKAAGSFTLNLVGGSLWCPDCVNVDANLVETDAFRAWVAERGLYCTAIDVPAFPKNGKTCLLAYEPTSVSDRYVNATVPPQERLQSGAGYLSRKGIPLTGNGGTNATDILARNLNLVTNAVSNGGLCRPECLDTANTATFSWKTGVPCLIVQDAAGRILGRLDQFSNVSPTDAHAAAAYVRRLDEILLLADDPTEELNRDWQTATTDDCALDIRGGMRTSTVSAVDLSDYWRLTGRDRWTRTTLAVKGRTGGTDETDVRLNLWRVTGGKAVKVAMREGNLASGVTLPAQELSADPEVEYFVQVEAIETSGAFALDRDESSLAAYDLTAESADDAGTVSFGESARTVSEAEAKRAGGALRVRVPAVRTGGASGATNATVTVDAASTAFSDRYRLVADTVAWADGERGTKNFEIDVFDDGNADGTQVLRLTLGGAAFALTIEDNDRLNVGKLAFADAEPALAKKGLVIAEEGTRVRIGVARLGGASGGVSCALKATAGTFAAEPTFAWASRASGTQWAELDLPTRADCPAGKVTLSFAALEGGVKADASARTLTVQLVGADAPRFEADSLSLGLTRYCAVSQEVAVLNLADGAKAKVAKLSGSVPSGVSARLAGGRLVVSGAPTAKGGAYEAVYQVSQSVGRKTEPGLTIRLAFAVTDVAALDPSAPGANPSVRARRTVPDMMVVDEAGQRLVGILSNLTIQPTGRCTAKYRCPAGTVSLSSRGWAGYDAATGALTARLTVAKKPYALAVTAQPDGTVEAALADPDFADGLAVAAPATAWSRENPATAWVGAYAAAFGDAEGEALARGAPVVTLTMTASAARTGTMRYAGFLPNGQPFSGSSVLVADGVDAAWLPVYYRTAKDLFTAVLRIKAGGAVQAVTCDADVRPGWTHAEALPEACSEVRYGSAVGSRIDARQDLLETVDPAANGHDLVAAGALEAIPVTISEKTAKLDPSAARAVGATLSLSRATGLLSGRFRTRDASGRTVTANHRSVILPDWGDGCPSCGDVPWAMGAYWFGERLTGELDGRPKTLTVKVGDTLYIEANK